MSPRSRIVGPGRAPVSRAAMPLVVSWTVTSRARPSSAAEHVLPGDRQVVADSGHRCSVRRSSTAPPAGRGLPRAAGRVDGHRAMVGTAVADARSERRVGDELVDVVDEHDHVVATVTRRRMRARAAAPPGRVRRRDVADRGCSSTAAATPRTCGRGAGTSPSAASSRPASRTTRPPCGSWPRRSAWSASCRRSSPPGATPTPTWTSSAACYRVVHDGPFRFADGEVVEARWVDAAGLRRAHRRRVVRARQPRPAAGRGRCFPFRPWRPPGEVADLESGTGRDAR